MRTRFESHLRMVRSKLVVVAASVITALLLTGSTAGAQTITGKVTDAETGSPLPGARVSASNGLQSTIVRSDGTYRLSVPAGTHAVRVSFIGYTPVRDTVLVTAAGAVRDYKLTKGGVQLDASVVI